jgi:ATP-dependent RNA helicase DeaD
MASFDELGINKKLIRAIADMGWTEPTPIQLQSVPVGMSGKDLFGQAQTGTGKTGAFSIVSIGRTKSGSKEPTILVMAPTRELAVQISKEMSELSKYTRHSIVPVYGGASYVEQIKGLESGCDIVVGTPGRIIDLCKRGNLKLDSVRELVIDEADRMLDMGFIDDMDEIISMVPSHRQTMMFSATLSDEVRSIAERSMKEPVEISVSQDSLVPELVRQYYVEVKRNGKMDVLRDIMANGDPKMVVFCATKKMVDDLYDGLSKEGLRIGAIHGDMPQSRREKTIRSFKADRMNMLIATDVAARGLDIDNIECVVNYDAPLDPETYAHRIGRTGRAGREGVAFTFITPKEDLRVPAYQQFMGKEIERVTRKQIPKLKIANPDLKALHGTGRSESGAKGKSHVPPVHQRSRAKSEALSAPEFMVVSLDIPKGSEITRSDISEFIVLSSGISRDKVGRIGMGSRSTFVEIEASSVDSVIKAVNSTKLNGRKVRASPAPAKVKYKDKIGKKS